MSIFDDAEFAEFETVVARTFEAPAPAGRWTGFAEAGWLSLTHGTAHGGLGGGLVELAVIQRALGRTMAAEPLLATLGIAVPLIEAMAPPAVRNDLLSAIATGGMAFGVSQIVPSPADLACDGEGRWSGTVRHVALDGGVTHVVAWTGTGKAVLLLDLRSPGITTTGIRGLDGRTLATLTLEKAEVEHVFTGCEVGINVALVQARAAILAAAEAVGAIEGACAATLDFVGSRRQFGRPIGTFQAVQHRFADMLVAQCRARAVTAAIARCFDEGVGGRLALASACKVAVGRAGRLVAESAVQLHGGMGVTQEGAAGRYMLRLLALGDAFGGTDHHLGRLADAPEHVFELIA